MPTNHLPRPNGNRFAFSRTGYLSALFMAAERRAGIANPDAEPDRVLETLNGAAHGH